MPANIRQLAELNLHDAELVAGDRCDGVLGPAPLSPVAMLLLKQNSSIVYLIYTLWDRVRENPPPPNWPFSKFRTHWLYDRIDESAHAPTVPGRTGL